MTVTLHDNPLLAHGALPRFAEVAAEHVQPAVDQLLRDLETEVAALEAAALDSKVPASWEGLAAPLERIQDRLEFTWGTVGHLLSVCNSAELRVAHESAQPAIVQFSMRMGQSRPLYEAFKTLRDAGPLSKPRQRIVDAAIRDAELSGVGLDGAAKQRFNAIQMEMADLQTRFSNHVLDATKAFALDLTLHSEVEGLPASLLALAAQTARNVHETATAEHGPWRITLDFPSFGPFMQHSRRRDLREDLYRAMVRRASAGELDNTQIIQQILALRLEMAQILGYADFAALSLASKMAEGPDEVRTLLEELRVASYPAGLRDFQELRDFSRAQGADEADELMHWDVAYWSERLREARYDYSDEELRPYFPLPKVLDGVFALAHKLFGVSIAEDRSPLVPKWHEHVQFFRIADEHGQPLAAFYLDPYSRPAQKRGGAWMNECVGRSRLFGTPAQPVRLPIAYLVCNQSPPVDDQPSLMTFHEVETLLHEFGHGLQHMLTTVDEGLAAGIRGVEWDAVELPSQFMENWCFHKPTLRSLSGHVTTGEPLPDELFDKLTAARTYRAGSDMLRQLTFALTDLQLHHGFDPASDSPFEVHRLVASRTAVLPPLPEDKFLCSFSHIFAGGYAAGYYSYKWAEVLSADAFSAFEEAGLDDEGAVMATGRRFRDTVLALGGSAHPLDVFTEFRGRAPSTDALLRHAGLR